VKEGAWYCRGCFQLQCISLYLTQFWSQVSLTVETQASVYPVATKLVVGLRVIIRNKFFVLVLIGEVVD